MNNKIAIFVCLFLFRYIFVCSQTTTIDYEKWLDEVYVTANNPLYHLDTDVIIYDVKNDSTLKDKTCFDALINTPMLIVERNGKISTSGNYPLEFLFNGKHNFLLSGNILDATETIDAKHIKQIEVRLYRTVDGTDKLQVNIVTKGRLFGYRGVLSSTLSDSYLRSGGSVFSKKGKWGVSAVYYNTWQWGHTSKEMKEETRSDMESSQRINRISYNSDYKTDLNNMEMTISNEIDSLTEFSIYGRTLLKIDPRRKSRVLCSANNENMNLIYDYDKYSKFKADDAEYEFDVGYERLFGEDAERGKVFLSYEFYRRYLNSLSTDKYTYLQYDDADAVSSFYDMEENFMRREDWHSIYAIYRRVINKHEVNIENLLRYRDETENTEQRQYYDYSATPFLSNDELHFKHAQIGNLLQLGYNYNLDKMKFGIGGTWTYLYDKTKSAELDDEYRRHTQYITPFANVNYVLSHKIRFQLRWSMYKLVPDIEALNPYVYTNVYGQQAYGNPNLKPEKSQTVTLATNMNIGRFEIYGGLSNSFSDHLILQHSFLENGILNITKDNLGKRYSSALKTDISSRITNSTRIHLGMSLYYTYYNSTSEYKGNKGFTFSTNASIDKELPRNFDLSLYGGLNTPWVYLQGNGGKNYYYGFSLIKSIPNKRLSLSIEAKSFVPIHYTDKSECVSEGYYSITRNRNYHASFMFNIRWRFGKLKSDIRELEEEITHKDIKRNYDE